MHGAERDKYPLNHPKFLAFLPSTHNDGRKISVVYEGIMKIRAFPSPFWFAIHEGYPPRPLFVQAIRGEKMKEMIFGIVMSNAV